MNELLSKLKMAGRLRFWRGTVEIDEHELHAICDEIQAEHDKAVAAMNKAAGNWAKADSQLREDNSEGRYRMPALSVLTENRRGLDVLVQTEK